MILFFPITENEYGYKKVTARLLKREGIRSRSVRMATTNLYSVHTRDSLGSALSKQQFWHGENQITTSQNRLDDDLIY